MTLEANPTPSAPVNDLDMATEVATKFEGGIFEMMGLEDGKEPVERDDSGRFKGEAPEAKSPDKVEAKDAKADDQTDEDAEDEIEIPAEKEGEQPKRLKLSEVLDRAQRAEKLAAEVEDLKSKPIVAPEQWDRGIMEAVQVSQALTQRMAQWQQVNMPRQPDPRNFHSIEELRAAQDWYNHQVQQWVAVDKERKTLEANQTKQAQAVEAAQRQRHLAQIQEFWPEIKGRETAQKVQDDLIKTYGKYGMTPELIGSISHPAFYALAKDALKGRQAEAVKEQVAKVVQAKPKLIKGQARQATPSKPDLSADFARLAKSGKAEDAYSIAERLFS